MGIAWLMLGIGIAAVFAGLMTEPKPIGWLIAIVGGVLCLVAVLRICF